RTGAGGQRASVARRRRRQAEREGGDRARSGREGRLEDEVVPTVTALHADRRGRVAVELDGSPWRVLPVAVVVRAGLVEGRPLDRPALRLAPRRLRGAGGPPGAPGRRAPPPPSP